MYFRVFSVVRLMCGTVCCDSMETRRYTLPHAMDTPGSHVYCWTLGRRSACKTRLAIPHLYTRDNVALLYISVHLYYAVWQQSTIYTCTQTFKNAHIKRQKSFKSYKLMSWQIMSRTAFFIVRWLTWIDNKSHRFPMATINSLWDQTSSSAIADRPCCRVG